MKGIKMRAIKIDPHTKTIVEIELTSLDELVSIIGNDRLQFIPLERGINLLSGLDDETKPSFGFYGVDDIVVYGIAVVVGGSRKRIRRLHEGIASFEALVEWK